MNIDRSPRSRSMRAARSAVFAVAGTALAVVAHRLGGGMTPTPSVALLVGGALLAVVYPFTARQRGGVMITALVLTTQTLMHLALSVTSAHTMNMAAPMAMTSASHGMASMSSPTMLAGHVLAAMAMAWWLTRGEHHVWHYARRIVETARRLTTGLPRRRTRPAPAPLPTVVTLAQRVWASAAPGRAPPLFVTPQHPPAAA